MKRLKLCLVILINASNLFLPSQSILSVPVSSTRITDEYATKLQRFEEFVKGQMEKDKIPGLTIGFTKDKVTWIKGFGYADLENKIPASANSHYRLASVTKTFTGTAILQLVEQGKIKLDEEIHAGLVLGSDVHARSKQRRAFRRPRRWQLVLHARMARFPGQRAIRFLQRRWPNGHQYDGPAHTRKETLHLIRV